MAEWEPVIGLEVHAHLKTRTKMFCRCAARVRRARELGTCPVCLAHPGALPVANRRAIEFTIKLGLALECEIADARDLRAQELLLPRPAEGLPDQPVRGAAVRAGPARRPVDGGEEVVGIVRAHLEEDAAKTVHAGGATGRSVGATASLVDFNRGGTPLLEIVTEPDLRSADEALRFLRLLRQTIVELGDLRRRDGEGHAARRRQRLGSRARARRDTGRAGRSRT